MNSEDVPPDGQDEPDVGHGGRAEFAEFAEHAQFAEFAARAEFAKFAEHETPPEGAVSPEGRPSPEGQPSRGGELLPGGQPSAEGGGAAGAAEPGEVAGARRLRGHAGPDGQPDLLHLHETPHVLDQAANRLQVAGRARLRPQDKPEPRWPVSAAVPPGGTLAVPRLHVPADVRG